MHHEPSAAHASEESVTQDQYAALIRVLPDAVVVHGGGRILFVNRAAVALFGAKGPEDLVGRRVHDLVDPEFSASVTQRVTQMVGGRGVAELAEEKLLRLDGEPIDAEVTAMTIRYEGRPAIQAIVRDITRRKRAEEALRESEERFRRLAETIPEIFWMIEPRKPHPWYVSPAGERIYGISNAEFRSNPQITLERIHPEDQARVLPIMLENPAKPYDLEYRIMRPDKQIRWVRSRSFPTVDESGEIVRVSGFTEDITARKHAEKATLALLREQERLATERRQAERALASSERKFREIFDSSLDAIAITEWATGAYLDVNREFEAQSGFSRAETLGRTPGELALWTDRDAYKEMLAALRCDGVVRNYEAELRRKDGTTVWTLFSALRLDLGGTLCVVAITRDVTAKLETQRELIAAKDAALESSRLKSAFLANMSHEIRTPLNVMLGLTSIVAQHLADSGDHSQDQHFEGIERASRRLLATIHGILDLSKIETGSFEVLPALVDLRSLVAHQLADFAPLAERKGIALRSEIEVGETTVRGDEYCLSQAIANLLDNAIKFTERGHVIVRLRRDREGVPLLEIEDTGVGIEKAFLPRLGESFSQEDAGYTRRFEGSGLGLALVKKYLEMNGARMVVDSRKGEGSIFRICFSGAAASPPRIADKTLVARRDPAAKSSSAPGGEERSKILLVEDDLDTRAYMEGLLRRRFVVLCATSGEEFRERLASHGRELRLILMDLSIRGSEDGLALTSYVRRHPEWRGLPIIAVSAHAFEKDRENAARAGCDDYVTKPIDQQELFTKIGRALREERRASVTPTSGAFSVSGSG